jgi:hypothetical protein
VHEARKGIRERREIGAKIRLKKKKNNNKRGGDKEAEKEDGGKE